MGANKRVLVAMSGGVDSSVVAALLKRDGWDVFGVTLQLNPCEDRGLARSCCGVDAVLNARRVADQLGIEHMLLDCRREFSRLVLEPAWREYARGRTPSPCILCNERIKFGLLLDKALALGAGRIATGHYARIIDREGRLALARPLDRAKDQSYFLFALGQVQLERTLLPLGELTKPQVRELARELGLATAERRESQDACLGSGADFAESLRLRYGDEPRSGDIVDTSGRIVGRHDGLHRFTIGQRRGLGVALGKSAFVCAIDGENANVVVTTEPRDLWSAGLVVRLLTDRSLPQRCAAQIRSRHTPAPASVTIVEPGLAEVRFDEPQRAVAPGQAAVLYDGEVVAGGGWIERAIGPGAAPHSVG
ncbi:MAG: tRNA 2-thiouridine(34) synthase MnmA [Myxococcales bacterium]|jgi:tRNA-specific 2-thiouridylase